MELNYQQIVNLCFSGYKKKPTEDQLWECFADMAKHFLVVLYEVDCCWWAQFVTSVKYLPTYKTRGDELSPAPPANMLEASRIGHIAWKKAKSNAVNLSEKFSKFSEGFENLSNSFEHFETFSLERRGVGVGEGIGDGVGEKPIAPSKLEAQAPPQSTFIELLTLQQSFAVSDREVDSWSALYPAVDVRQALRNMAGWLEGSPRRRKSLQGMSRFVHNWLRGDQDKGGTHGAQQGSTSGSRPTSPATQRVQNGVGAFRKAAEQFGAERASGVDGADGGAIPASGHGGGGQELSLRLRAPDGKARSAGSEDSAPEFAH